MLGLVGSCTCSKCPIEPSSTIVPADKLKEIVKSLGAGGVTFDVAGNFFIDGQMVDQRNRNLALETIIVVCSTDLVTLVHPALYLNCMALLQKYYQHSKKTQANVKRVRISPIEGGIALDFCNALAWQIMRGPPRAADVAICLTRILCRDQTDAKRMTCLLWKKEQKSKSYPGVSNLVSRLGQKGVSKDLEEDCVRILVRLVGDDDSIMRLARIKSTSKAFGNVLQTGTSKAISNILWLTWRMTLDAQFCKSIAKNNEMMKTLVGLATIETGSIPGLREENALAVLANLSVEDEVGAILLERFPELLQSAARAIALGSTRAVELGALLIGNLAFHETAHAVLSGMDIDVTRLVGIMIEGGDRARELSTLALANLTRTEKVAKQVAAAEGGMEVILSVGESGATGRAREAAERVIANCAIHRLKSKGVTMPLGKAKSCSEHTFKDTTLKMQPKIKQFGFLKSQTFSKPWAEAKDAWRDRFPEIAKRCDSQLSMASSTSDRIENWVEYGVVQTVIRGPQQALVRRQAFNGDSEERAHLYKGLSMPPI